MASSQVEAASPAPQEITDQPEETTRPCCAHGQKQETAKEEPKADIHEGEEEIAEEENYKDDKGEELFKEEEEKVADSPITSEEKPVPTYGRKTDPEDDEEEEEEDEEEMV